MLCRLKCARNKSEKFKSNETHTHTHKHKAHKNEKEEEKERSLKTLPSSMWIQKKKKWIQINKNSEEKMRVFSILKNILWGDWNRATIISFLILKPCLRFRISVICDGFFSSSSDSFCKRILRLKIHFRVALKIRIFFSDHHRSATFFFLLEMFFFFLKHVE